MGRFILRRLLWMFLVLFVVSFITFFLMHQVPGGPFDKEKALPAQIMANMNQRYHLDWPLWRQYLQYVYDVMVPRVTTTAPSGSILDQFLVEVKAGPVYLRWMNFGPSYASTSRTVTDIFREQLPISMQLGVMAMLFAMALGIPLGTVAALKQNTWLDYGSMGMTIMGVSVPAIVMGPILAWLFGVWLKVLPVTGWGAKAPFILGLFPRNVSLDYWKYMVMPAIALGLGGSAMLARLTRASLLQVIREDYIRTARAKGLHERTVIVRHALRNSLIPVVTVLGPYFATIVTGSFVIESLFGIPGIGKYFITSIGNRDYPVVMGTILLFALILVLANTVVDVLYGLLDPRIRSSYNE